MNEQVRRPDTSQGVTQVLAHRVASLEYGDLPAGVAEIAKQCIPDWVAVTIQGTRDPLVEIHAEQVAAANVHDPGLQALRDKVEVTFAPDCSLTRSEVTVELADGRVLDGSHDSGLPEKDLDRRQTKLLAKFRLLVGPVFGLGEVDDIAANILSLERQAALKHLTSRLVHGQR